MTSTVLKSTTVAGLVTLILCLGVGSLAMAQEARPDIRQSAPGDCLSTSPTSPVTVSTFAGRTVRGTLVCFSEDAAWLLREGELTPISLGDVQRIRTTADPVWDGAAIGAVIPLIVWAVLCHECSAEPWLKSSLTYGLIGLASDAISSNRKTLYEGRSRALSVAWGISF